tara:strand:+ start:997 stop:1383 length:387 start_codon:yes stop_codon:yes gene_type:complete
MSDEQHKPSDERTDESAETKSPKTKDSFVDYSTRITKDIESSSPVQACRRYLRSADPASIMIHALFLFFVSLILAFIASNTISATISVQSVPAFFATLSSLCRVSSMMLVAWAIGRLIADAIENRAKS